MIFDSAISKLNNIKSNIDNLVIESAFTVQTAAIELIANDQMWERGVDGDNVGIGQYSIRWFLYKNNVAGLIGRDTRSDHITLRDTGDFHRSITLSKSGIGLIIEADSIKIDKETGRETDLLAEWGEAIIELTDENLQKFSLQYVKPELLRRINGLL